jgi:hypothetical protein
MTLPRYWQRPAEFDHAVRLTFYRLSSLRNSRDNRLPSSNCPKKTTRPLEIAINLNQGCTISGHWVAVATRFCTVATVASCHPSGSWNFEMAVRFLEKFMHLWFKVCVKIRFRPHRDQTPSPLQRPVSAVGDIMAVVCSNHTEQIHCLGRREKL